MPRAISLNNDQAERLGVPVSNGLNELRRKQETVIADARSVLDKMTDDLSTAEVRRLEKQHDDLMAEFDRLEELCQREGAVAVRSAQARMRPLPGDAVGYGVDDGRVGFSEPEPGEAFALRSNQTFASHVAERRSGNVEFSELSTGAYLRAMVIGAKTDVEKRALAEGTDSAGGYTVPDILSARLIDRMRAASVVMRAGAQVVPLGSDTTYIAKVATDPVPAWRVENSAIAESDPTFGRVTFTARSLAVMVKASRELMEDSINLETALPNLLATALAQERDRVALLGSGVAPDPRGGATLLGLTANTFVGGPLLGYGGLIKARTALRTVNSDVTAYILSPRDEGWLAELTDNHGQPLNIPPAIAKVPMLTTSKMPVTLGAGDDESIILAGDWSRLMIGVRTDITVGVLRERYADTWQYGFVAVMRADIAAEHEAAFTKLTGVVLPEPDEEE